MTAEEMLTQTLAEASNNYPTLTVDWYTRQITIPNELKFLGVESDDDVRKVKFVIPRRYRDVDLSEFTISINYLNANAEGDIYLARDVVIEDDFITFIWLIGRRALAYKGSVKFNVCLKKADYNEPDVVTKELNTTIASLPVLEGLETNEAVIQEHADIILQWEQELENKFNLLATQIGDTVAEKTDDANLEKLFKAYLDEHPVDTITEEELNKAVEDYLTENPIKTGVSLPDGGSAGQVLMKNSEADGDAVWSDPPETGLTEVSWGDISNRPDTFPPSEHSHDVSWNDISDKPDRYPSSEHSHDVTWADIGNKPEFTANYVGAVPAERVNQDLTTTSEVTFKKVTADVVIGAVYM